jgi:glucose/arabinose dehydrogenase
MSRLLLLLVTLAGCSGSSTPASDPIVGAPARLRAVEVVSGLTNPVYLTAPEADSRLFVVEQPGRIRIIRNGSLIAQPFLDITSKVGYGGERGLLSVAFDPTYATTGHFWVNYTSLLGDTRIERYTVSQANPDVADAGSAKLMLAIMQPYTNHNGGHILFGPDRMLYIGMGDGGSGGDPQGHGQNQNSLLGKMLRIDVRSGDPYSIPQSNPFRGRTDAKPEIWATGMRNPWRFAFDTAAGLIYIADVGQNEYEEINAQPLSAAGLNYGWNRMEGKHCYRIVCSQDGLVIPVHEYDHGSGCSITGGFVYRGTKLTGLKGHYFYSDYCEGWLRSLRVVNGQAQDHTEWPIGSVGQVLSFGEDAAGELYILSGNGRVYRIDPD